MTAAGENAEIPAFFPSGLEKTPDRMYSKLKS